ncbi:hypothetical protein GCM10010377_58310 [Streptomyces viridiviolaceus]|nr:hypothetical protein GCM10010377_58310 [Streptomyces viridiviolaceus]
MLRAAAVNRGPRADRPGRYRPTASVSPTAGGRPDPPPRPCRPGALRLPPPRTGPDAPPAPADPTAPRRPRPSQAAPGRPATVNDHMTAVCDRRATVPCPCATPDDRGRT